MPAEQSEVAGHGREGRLPRMFFRRLPGRAARTTEAMGAATWRVSLPDSDTYTKTTESCKTCLPGDTSFMHLKTEENRRGTLGMPDLQEDGRHNGKKEGNNSPGRGQGRGGTEEEQPRKF